TGGVIGTLPVAMLPGGPIAQGAAAGLMLSEDPEDPQGLMRDATIGGVAGKAGDVVGRKVIGPAASRVMSSKPAQTLKQLITGSSDDFAGLGDDAVRVANQLRTP